MRSKELQTVLAAIRTEAGPIQYDRSAVDRGAATIRSALRTRRRASWLTYNEIPTANAKRPPSPRKNEWRVTIQRLAPYLKELMPDLTRAQSRGIARSIKRGLEFEMQDEEVARLIEAYDVEPERARTIARTEMARAREDGKIGRLKPGQRLRYKLADGACPKCVKVARRLKGRRLTAYQAKGIIPVHPSCYCGWETVSAKTGRKITTNESGEAQSEILEFARMVENVFCATGEGGGVDPSCSPYGGYTTKKSIPIERRGTSTSRGGDDAAGIFFSDRGDGVSEYGETVLTASVRPGAKLWKDKSSKDFLEREGKFGGDLKDLDDKAASGEINPDVYFNAIQTASKEILAARGYQGAHWTEEEDLAPVQYQIWDRDVIRVSVADKKRNKGVPVFNNLNLLTLTTATKKIADVPVRGDVLEFARMTDNANPEGCNQYTGPDCHGSSSHLFGSADPFIYHISPKTVPISSFSKGLRPSTEGYSGAGVYMATTPEEGQYHIKLKDARVFRISKKKLVDRYGVYPAVKDGLEFDDDTNELLLSGNRTIPAEFLEYRDENGRWNPVTGSPTKSRSSSSSGKDTREGIIQQIKRIDRSKPGWMLQEMQLRKKLSQLTENVFCATGEGGGVDPTCKVGDTVVVRGKSYTVTGGGVVEKRGKNKGRKPLVLRDSQQKIVIAYEDEVEKSSVKESVITASETDEGRLTTVPKEVADLSQNAIKVLREPYRSRKYTLKMMDLKDVTPSQTGEDYINPSSQYLSKHISQFGASGRLEDYAPIVVDYDGKIVDGNHRHAARKLAKIHNIPVLVPVTD